VLIPIATGPVLESCPISAVPVSTGVATLIDSSHATDPRYGMQYRYTAEGVVTLSVFILAASGATPREQLDQLIDSLRGESRVGFRIVSDTASVLRLDGGSVQGHATRVSWTERGIAFEDFVAAYQVDGRHHLFRASYAPNRNVHVIAEYFTLQVMSAIVARPQHCR
jgi:hypothetical protein